MSRNSFLIFIVSLIVLSEGSYAQTIFPDQTNSVVSKAKAIVSDSIDILHYNINLDIIDFSSQQIAGFTDLKITAKTNNINTIPLDLLKLIVDSIKINNIIVAAYNYNDTLLRIPLSTSIGVGDTVDVKVYYHGHPVQDASWGGFYFNNSYAFNMGVGFDSDPHNFGRVWYPCIDDFVDRATYDYFIRTDSANIAVCGGVLVSEVNNSDNTKTYHWQLNQSIPTYLSSVAVGNYVAVTDTFQSMNGVIPIYIYVRPADTNKAKASFIHLENMLTIFESAFGPYLWDRVGYIGVPFSSGAMEHATNIAIGNGFINGTLNYETLIAHELSHHWFGNLVTCSSALDMWLNEGWAVYCESIFMNGLFGYQAFKDYNRDNLHYVIQYAHIQDNGYRAVYGIPHEYTYGTTVYDKGATVAHSLRGYLGDSLFFSSIKSYINQFAFNNASSIDMRDFITSHTGINMNDFFDAWVFELGFPHYSVDSFNIIQTPQPECTVNVYVRQKLKARTILANSNILDVTFMDNNWQTYTDTIHFSGQTGSKSFTVPFTPESVMLDVEERISDATIDLYQTIKSTGLIDYNHTYFKLDVEQVSDSAFVRVVHNWVGPDPLKNPSADIFRIAKNRYWIVEGIFPTGFKSKGVFHFSRIQNVQLGDLELMPSISSADSLVLLYRKNAVEDWRVVNFVKTGNFLQGDLISQNVQPGEYALGIGLPNQSKVENSNSDKIKGLNVYPNPSGKLFNIELDVKQKSALKIYDLNGKIVYRIDVMPNQRKILWNAEKQNDGTYLIKLYTKDNGLIAAKQVLLIKE